MKKVLAIVSTLIFVLGLINIPAKADNAMGVAFVTCTQCTMRSTPASNAGSNGKLKNGSYVVVISEAYNQQRNESFYAVISQESWNAGLRNVEGYVLKQYLKFGLKQWITLPSSTVIWAMPGSQVAVGERSTGNTLVVLDEINTYNQYTGGYEGYWCVQMQDTVGGAGFISKSVVSNTWTRPEELEFYYHVMGSSQGSDIPNTQNVLGERYRFEPSQQTTSYNGLKVGGKAVVNCKTLAVKSQPDDDRKSIGFLHRGDEVQIAEIGEYYTGIYYQYKSINVAYVHTKYLLGISE